MKELDVYEVLKSLGNYLKTDIDVTSGPFESSVIGGVSRVTKEREGHNVKVTISNTAPIETNWPAIVFTGVGLTVKFPTSLHRTITRMRNEGNFQVDLTNAPQQGNPYRIEGSDRVNGEEYPAILSNEQRQGYVLFLGCSITYEMSLTSKECPDIKDMKFWI